MFVLFETENLSRMFFKAKTPLDIPDFPGPVFNLGCKINGVSHTTGQLNSPILKFKDASDKDAEYAIKSPSSLFSATEIWEDGEKI